MADSNKVDINFSAETARARGEVRKFKGEIEAVGPTGKKAAASITGSFKTIEGAIGKVRKAIHTLSFGTMLIESLTNLVGKFQAWREEMRKAEVEAQKLKNAAKFDEQTRGVDALTERYKSLAEAIQAAGKAAQENERVASAALDAQRKQEDAQLALREEQEVAALDRNDPAYSAKVAQIRQRYAGARAALGAGRSEEDAAARQKAYEKEAFDEDVNSATYSRNAAAAKSQEEEMRKQAELWGRIAAYGTQKSKEGIFSGIAGTNRSGKMLADFFAAGGDQSFMEAIKGMTPEEIAKYAAEQQAMFAGKADKAGESAAAFKGKAAESAAKSKTAAALAESQAGIVAAAKTKRQATGIAGETSAADSAASVESAERADRERREAEEAKRAAEEAKKASALAAVGTLTGQRGGILEAIEAEQQKKSAASRQVWEAQNALTLAQANGDRAGIGSASTALAAAQENAQSVGAAADKALADLSATLKSIEQRLQAASNYLKQQQSQNTYAWSESPAGS